MQPLPEPRKPGWLDSVDAALEPTVQQQLRQQAANLSEPPPQRSLAATHLPVREVLGEGQQRGYQWATFYARSGNEKVNFGDVVGAFILLIISFLLGGAFFGGKTTSYSHLQDNEGEALQLEANALRLRLLHDRDVTAADLLTNRERQRFIKQRHHIHYAEIEQIAFFNCRYLDQPDAYLYYNRLYWVKVWQRDKGNYVALVSDREQHARQLCATLAEQAGLQEYASIQAESGKLTNATLHYPVPLDQEQLAADLAQISLADVPTRVEGQLWRQVAEAENVV